MIVEDKEFLSLKEIQERLGIGRNQSYKIIQPGPYSLPAYRCGRKILVRRQDLETWLEKNRYIPEPANFSDKRISNPKERK